MKTIIPLTLLAAFAATNSLVANPAYSKPSGYVTQTLSQGFNLVGLTLHNAPIASGTIDSAAGNVLTDNQAAFSTVAGKTYILEITSGTYSGGIQVLTPANITSTTLTTPENISAQVVGASYVMRIAPTIEEVFGTTNSILGKGATAGAATTDVVWVPSSPGVFTRYFIRTSDSTVRNAQNNAAAPNVPIIFTDALFVQKKTSGSASLVVTGQVKTNNTLTVIETGFNLVATSFPVGSTLQNCNLITSIGRGATAGAATTDVVWVPTSPGSFTRYYARANETSWRNAQNNAVVTADVPLTSGIFIQRKGQASVPTNFTPPSAYSNL